MDLIRKMSGLRSSQDLSAAVEQSKKNEAASEDKWGGESSDREEENEGEEDVNELLLHDADQDDGDVFEDAAAALGQQPQRQQHVEGEEEDEEQRVSSRNDEEEEEAPAGASPIRVRQDDADGGREDEDEDGRGSHGSGESFDSAVERMAASSESGYDTASSPKTASPVGSLQHAHTIMVGNPPTVALSPSQQGALIRLNEMITGDSSLDTSVIDNSTREEFKSRVTRLAHSRGQSEEDLSFVSIVDALLPLVPEKSPLVGDGQTDEASLGAANDAESKDAQSRMPKAKLFADAEDDGGDEKAVENGTLKNGDDPIDEVQAEGSDEEMPRAKVSPENEDSIEERGEDELSSGGEQEEDVEGPVDESTLEMPRAKVSPENEDSIEERGEGELGSDGEREEDIEEPVHESAQDMPIAKLSVENEDSIEERGEGEPSSGGQREEDNEGPVHESTGDVGNQDDSPVKIRAMPSDLDDSVLLPETEHERPNPEPRENGDNVAQSQSTEQDERSAGEVPQLGSEANNNDEETTGISSELNREGMHETSVVNLDDDEDEDEEDDEEGEEEDEGSNMEAAAALAALIHGAESAIGGEADVSPSLGSAGPSLPARPTRTVRSSLPSLEPASRAAAQQQPRSTGPSSIRPTNSVEETQANSEPDGNEETREKLQSIRVKFLRLALRLGQSPHNVVVAQVLYRLGLAEQLRGGRSNSRNAAFSFDRASSIAEEQERAGPEELDFACTIMMLGKTGVGKSATINSIFDEAKTGTDAFSPATNKVQVITGHVHGIKVRVIDTPGLLPCIADQRHNERIMASVKGFIKKESPDIVLYFDRLDMQSRDYGDLPLLRTITDTFGAAVWFNAIVVLTHASSAPPDGPNGLPLSYEMFVAQRSHVVQQTIRQAAGDMRLMNPVSLVENHTACRVNRSGDRVLPNGQVWKPQLLLLCFASKILAEANSLLKLQDNAPGKPFGQRSRVPPLPFLLSSLLQSRAPLKLPDEQVGDEDESDEELEEGDDDSEDEEDYDQLPPFRRLAKEEIAELDEVNRGEYFEELAERERLFQKKQWKEELKRRRDMKKRMAEAPTDQSQFGDDGTEEDLARSAAVPVPMPDMVLPPSFDSDNPSHRYRYLETANQWLVRPVLETHGWDHDNGYDGMSVEKMFVIGDKIPTSISGQITKDKKEANLNMEAASSLSHGEGKVTLAGVDVQTVGKDLACTLRSETRFSNFKGNKTTGGLALTALGDTVSAGMKIEDRLLVGKRVKLVVNGGAITGGGDVAYGGSLEATLRDKEYPLSRTLSTLGVSIMDWHGDLAVGGNLQSQFILGKTMIIGRGNLNNRGAGQISIRASSSEQLQMTLIGVIPIVRAIANRLFGQSQE